MEQTFRSEYGIGHLIKTRAHIKLPRSFSKQVGFASQQF